MITFRKKSVGDDDLKSKVIEYLDRESGSKYTLIPEKDADKASKLNSKALVLLSIEKTETGTYQLKIQSKEIYRYIQDTLLRDTFRMNITDVDKKDRIITAETNYLGVALDALAVISLNPHFNLSIVE